MTVNLRNRSAVKTFDFGQHQHHAPAHEDSNSSGPSYSFIGIMGLLLFFALIGSAIASGLK